MSDTAVRPRRRHRHGAAGRRRGGVRQTLSRATATPPSTPTSDLPVVDHAPDRLRAVEFAAVPRGHRRGGGVRDDGARGGAGDRRHACRRPCRLECCGCCVTNSASAASSSATISTCRRSPRPGPRPRRRWRRWPPAATPCWCAAAMSTCRPLTLEALVKAVESGALPLARVDDALARSARVKARFLRRHWRAHARAAARLARGSSAAKSIRS